jgi:hypothetical protein
MKIYLCYGIRVSLWRSLIWDCVMDADNGRIQEIVYDKIAAVNDDFIVQVTDRSDVLIGFCLDTIWDFDTRNPIFDLGASVRGATPIICGYYADVRAAARVLFEEPEKYEPATYVVSMDL